VAVDGGPQGGYVPGCREQLSLPPMPMNASYALTLPYTADVSAALDLAGRLGAHPVPSSPVIASPDGRPGA